jgi:hypothetical protein
MNKFFTRARIGVVAVALAAFSLPMLSAAPASADWYRPGWGWRAGWHPGWGYGWRGYGWGPRVVVGFPGVVVAPPVYRGPVWIRAHWNGPYFVPGHWG